jgi:hypothetical protein
LEAVNRTKVDAAWLQAVRGQVVKLIYMLLYDLPSVYEYRVVFMHRKLAEVLASQQTILERRGEKGCKSCSRTAAANFLRTVGKVLVWLQKQSNFSVLNTNYHDVPLDQSERISEFLGGGLDVERMAAAVVPSLYRQRKL